MGGFIGAHRRGELKAEILARVRRGESLRAICRQDGFPAQETVQAWRRADPLFAADLAEARAAGAGWLRSVYHPQVGEEILRRLRTGEPIADILRTPGMPSWKTYQYWRATQAPFCEEVGRLRDEARRWACRRWSIARARPWDPLMGDRVYLAVLRGASLRRLHEADPALPSGSVVARWRREQPEFDHLMRLGLKARRRPARRSPRLTRRLRQAVFDHIVGGGSLASYAAQRRTVCAETLYRWVKTDGEFGALVDQAKGYRAHLRNERRMDAAETELERMDAAFAQLQARRRHLGGP